MLNILNELELNKLEIWINKNLIECKVAKFQIDNFFDNLENKAKILSDKLKCCEQVIHNIEQIHNTIYSIN